MGASSGFPIDLILFGMIAVFLVLRLRSVLGRRTGFERPAQPYQPPQPQRPGPVIDAKAEPVPAPSTRKLPDPASPIGQTLSRFRNFDRNFDPGSFLEGAERAFRMIVAAFASGDRAALQGLLTKDTYAAFDGAISARERAGQVQVSEIRAIQSVAIESAELHGSVASVTMRIVSDQVSYTKDSTGHIIVGTDAVTEITDLWTFERDLSNADPTWRLAGAHSA